MINYSGLPQRLRRIVKQYEYCIESVGIDINRVCVRIKDGYICGGFTILDTADMEWLIDHLKKVTKPASRDIKIALYGFKCQICGLQVHKGSNYTDLGGLKICRICG